MVYNLLKNKYGEDKVFPKSEAFITLGKLLPGQARHCSYDWEYINEDGAIVCVEVKTGDANLFNMSLNEYEYAKANADNYELYVVYDMDKDEPKCFRVENKFWDDPRYHLHAVIEKYVVTF